MELLIIPVAFFLWLGFLWFLAEGVPSWFVARRHRKAAKMAEQQRQAYEYATRDWYTSGPEYRDPPVYLDRGPVVYTRPIDVNYKDQDYQDEGCDCCDARFDMGVFDEDLDMWEHAFDGDDMEAFDNDLDMAEHFWDHDDRFCRWFCPECGSAGNKGSICVHPEPIGQKYRV